MSSFWARCFMPRHWRRTSLDRPVRAANCGRPSIQKHNRLRASCGGPPLQGIAMRRTGFFFLLLTTLIGGTAGAQNLQAKANDIRAAVDARDFERAESLVRELGANDQAAFTRNNYDYLLARLLERRGARSEASALYLVTL